MAAAHAPSHGWQPLSVQRADYRPHMAQTGLAFHGLHKGAPAVLFGTSRQTTNFPASFQPLLSISANSVSQEVWSLHGSFQRRSHPTSSRVQTIPT
jgi:hypothetical protein